MLASKGGDTTLRAALARDLNRLLERELAGRRPGDTTAPAPLYDPERFGTVPLSGYLQDFIKENPQSHTRIRLNRLLLEAAYPTEIIKTKAGIYPDREIYIASPEDSMKCFNDYMADAQRRLQLNQLKPGEDVRYDRESGRVQVSGQVAVMAINGLLTKVMFDHNPKNEFYVEESFPLDWMYPHLTPYGVIMKINRQPLAELSEEIVKKDHDFWTQYSQRLIGDWVTYDTSVKEIASWVEKTYLRRNFTGFKGDRKFIRDDQAQKAFSKLRSSIGGVYAWRVGNAKRGSADYQRMYKEADFAFRQSFAFCPYSPEAVFRYVNLLLLEQRFEDALLVAQTCRKLDPYNGSVIDLVNRLQSWKSQQGALNPSQQSFGQLEKAVQDNPQNFQAAFNLAGLYLQQARTQEALAVLDRVLSHPAAEVGAFRALLQAYGSISNSTRVQQVVDKLAGIVRTNPADLDAAIALAEGYREQQKNELASQTLDQVLSSPKADATAVLAAAQVYASMLNYGKLEAALERLVKVAPDSPEAWYDLAALKATLGKPAEALPVLKQAVALSAARLKQNPKARDLAVEARKDPRLAPLSQNPEFKQITSPK